MLVGMGRFTGRKAQTPKRRCRGFLIKGRKMPKEKGHMDQQGGTLLHDHFFTWRIGPKKKGPKSIGPSNKEPSKKGACAVQKKVGREWLRGLTKSGGTLKEGPFRFWVVATSWAKLLKGSCWRKGSGNVTCFKGVGRPKACAR